jgi:hypothetical protein
VVDRRPDVPWLLRVCWEGLPWFGAAMAGVVPARVPAPPPPPPEPAGPPLSSAELAAWTSLTDHLR